MIYLKTSKQIAGIRKACELTRRTLSLMGDSIQAGMTTDELNEIGKNFIQDNGAIPAPFNYMGFPKETCISLNSVICHGIPNSDKIQEGDIVSIDTALILNGYYGDTCGTFPVGRISEEAQKLIQVTKEALDLGIKTVAPNKPIEWVGSAIEKHASKHGFTTVRDFVGHGVGLEFHEEPQIQHFKSHKTGIRFKEGMIFTIEPMLCQGNREVIIESDGWTAKTIDGKLSAQFEHTILVTKNGHEILT